MKRIDLSHFWHTDSIHRLIHLIYTIIISTVVWAHLNRPPSLCRVSSSWASDKHSIAFHCGEYKTSTLDPSSQEIKNKRGKQFAWSKRGHGGRLELIQLLQFKSRRHEKAKHLKAQEEQQTHVSFFPFFFVVTIAYYTVGIRIFWSSEKHKEKRERKKKEEKHNQKLPQQQGGWSRADGRHQHETHRLHRKMLCLQKRVVINIHLCSEQQQQQQPALLSFIT